MLARNYYTWFNSFQTVPAEQGGKFQRARASPSRGAAQVRPGRLHGGGEPPGHTRRKLNSDSGWPWCLFMIRVRGKGRGQGVRDRLSVADSHLLLHLCLPDEHPPECLDGLRLII